MWMSVLPFILLVIMFVLLGFAIYIGILLIKYLKIKLKEYE